jgi:hypothetical protein
MSCCNKLPTEKQDFILQKAKNFKTFILKQNPSEEVSKFLETFDESKINYTILTTLVPIKQMKTEEIMVDDLMNRLNPPEGTREDVKNKILRYFDMFVEVYLL